MKTFSIFLSIINILWGLSFYKSTKVKYNTDPFAFWLQRWYEKGYGCTMIDVLMFGIDIFSIFILLGYAFISHI